MAASIATSSGTARRDAARRTAATVPAGSVAKTHAASCQHLPATASRVMPPRTPWASPAMVPSSRDSSSAKGLGRGGRAASRPLPASTRATKRARSSSSGTTEKPSESMWVTARCTRAPSSPPWPKATSLAWKGGTKSEALGQIMYSASSSSTQRSSTSSGTRMPPLHGLAPTRGQAWQKLHLVAAASMVVQRPEDRLAL
mmetsp:Transcript_22963/g.65082  ORF Transcript_22963/g.65082 Transcript_22963/m.65082 type:complete len:200 (-) Transcript_22963:1908-2507(-)